MGVKIPAQLLAVTGYYGSTPYTASKQNVIFMPIEINGKPSEEYATALKLVKKHVKFKTIQPPLRAKTEEGYIERPMSSLSFPATYTRLKSDGTHDVVRYYENKTPIHTANGIVDYNYTPQFITIENGELNIPTATRKDLYWFLQNHPDNQSNSVYETDGKSTSEAATVVDILNARRTPFLFAEVDKRKSSKSVLEMEKKRDEAKALIYDEEKLSNKAVMTLYRAYNFHDADDLSIVEDYDTMRAALLDQAKVDPDKFMKFVDDAGLQLKATLNDALTLGVMKYDQPDGGQGAFYWGNVKKNRSKGELFTVLPHQFNEKNDLFIEFLRTTEKGALLAKSMREEVQEARKERLLAQI